MIRTDEDGTTWLKINPAEWCPWCWRKVGAETRKKLTNPPYHDGCYEQHFETEARKRSGAMHTP